MIQEKRWIYWKSFRFITGNSRKKWIYDYQYLCHFHKKKATVENIDQKWFLNLFPPRQDDDSSVEDKKKSFFFFCCWNEIDHVEMDQRLMKRRSTTWSSVGTSRSFVSHWTAGGPRGGACPPAAWTPGRPTRTSRPHRPASVRYRFVIQEKPSKTQ